MDRAHESAETIPAHLSVWDAVSIIIGIVVGAGIYQTPPLIFSTLSGLWLALGVWAGAGVLSLVGALCYAELATTYPHVGGDFVYLSRAYGRGMGFLFGWAQLAVILTANIGMMTYVFADYGTRLFYGQNRDLWYKTYGWLWAAGPVVVLTFLNILGVRAGKLTQNVLTIVKVLGLSAVIVAGLCWPASSSALAPTRPPEAINLAFAMVLVLFIYGGWNDSAYVAAEVRDGARGIPRALILGILAITGLYLLVNFAYLRGLGYDAASGSKAIAADVLAKPLGDWGEKGMCLLVMISALGAANGLIFTGARVSLALGREHTLFAWLGRWEGGRGVPYMALLTQAGISLAMIVAVGTPSGQQTLDSLFTGLGLTRVDWEGKSGFETLLKCTAPIFWLFFWLTGQSLFLLRAIDHDRPRPFPVPLYPYLPLVFCLMCVYMLISGISYAGALGLVGAGLLLAGVPLFLISESLRAAPASMPSLAEDKDGSDALQPDPRSITRRD